MFLSFVDEPGVLAPTMSSTAPSGLSGLEMELACAEPTALSDAELVDAAAGFERMVAWVAARQHTVLTVSRGSGAVLLAQARRLDGPLRATRDLLQAGRSTTRGLG